jgi:hypothetical protein
MVRGVHTYGQNANWGFGAFEDLPGRRLRPFEIPTDLGFNGPPFSQLRTCAGPH